MDSETSLQLIAGLEDLETIRKFIERRAAQLGIDQSMTYDIDLAITELATNALVHGYPERSGWLEIDVQKTAQGIEVFLRDQAPLFDPTQTPPPDLSLPLYKRRFGGMGIHLTRQVTRRFEYRTSPTGGNELYLVF